jgi:hypothetical protein
MRVLPQLPAIQFVSRGSLIRDEIIVLFYLNRADVNILGPELAPLISSDKFVVHFSKSGPVFLVSVTLLVIRVHLFG